MVVYYKYNQIYGCMIMIDRCAIVYPHSCVGQRLMYTCQCTTVQTVFIISCSAAEPDKVIKYGTAVMVGGRGRGGIMPYIYTA